MKAFKIVQQKRKVVGNPDQEFKDALNKFARESWRVISVCSMSHSTLEKAYLERDKLR